MNTTKISHTKKTDKIPAVKHFYDVNAAKKAKRLAKKMMKSRLVKSAKPVRGRRSTILGAATAAPVAVQLGTFAVLAAGGYALWKNREKIQKFVKGSMEGDRIESDSTLQ